MSHRLNNVYRAQIVGIVAIATDAVSRIIFFQTLVADFVMNVSIAAAEAVVVVQIGHAVCDLEDIVELTVCEPLHYLGDLTFHVGREALFLGLLLVVEEPTIKAEPHAAHRLNVPKHDLGVVVVARLVGIVHIL